MSAVHVHDDSMRHASVADGLVEDAVILRHILSDTGEPVALVHCTTLVCVPRSDVQLAEADASRADAAAVQALQGPTLHATMAPRHT